MTKFAFRQFMKNPYVFQICFRDFSWNYLETYLETYHETNLETYLETYHETNYHETNLES